MKIPKYKRILLKLSGEALTGDVEFGIDPSVLDRLADEISKVKDMGVEIGLVIGGGNLFRGKSLSELGLDRVTGDHMGMLATLMNALAMRDVFERSGLDCRIMSAIPMSGMVDHYDRRKAINHLEAGRLVIFAAGTGTPLVTTDSAASLRGIEVEADAILKATNVDGIYTADPLKDSKAIKFDKLTYQEVLEQELGVMDLAAFCQCRDHDMQLIVFNMGLPGALFRIMNGENEGTVVSKEN